jgi:pimeloyl-ACP methyl ester carboxylesterase
VRPTIDEGPRSSRISDASVDAPVVVLLHGQPGTAADWYRVVPLLSADHRVIAVDRPGYAGDAAVAQDWKGNAQSLLELLDRLALRKVLLVAASWAGGVAIELAAKAPERVSGIVYVASVGGRGDVTLFDRLLALRPVLAMGVPLAQHSASGVAALLSRVSGSRLDEEAGRESRLAYAVWRERHVWDAAALEQRYMVRDDEALRETVRHPGVQSVPSVVLQGTHDLILPFKAGADLAATLPHARWVPVDAGHLLAFEEPVAIAEAVRSLPAAP